MQIKTEILPMCSNSHRGWLWWRGDLATSLFCSGNNFSIHKKCSKQSRQSLKLSCHNKTCLTRHLNYSFHYTEPEYQSSYAATTKACINDNQQQHQYETPLQPSSQSRSYKKTVQSFLCLKTRNFIPATLILLP